MVSLRFTIVLLPFDQINEFRIALKLIFRSNEFSEIQGHFVRLFDMRQHSWRGTLQIAGLLRDFHADADDGIGGMEAGN